MDNEWFRVNEYRVSSDQTYASSCHVVNLEKVSEEARSKDPLAFDIGRSES